MLADEIPSALRVGWALVVAPGLDSCASVARGDSAPAWEGAAVPALVDLDRARALDDDETRSEMVSVGVVVAKGAQKEECEFAGALACAGFGPLRMGADTMREGAGAAGSDGAPLFGTR